MDNITLSPELIAKMKQIQFRMKSLVSEMFSGSYESAFKSRGVEFEEVRPYQAGDDVRSIDWNVTARTGTPFIKLYREERELTIMFLVDVSASMHFGTTNCFKNEIAAEITALLAYTALKNNDKIGLIIFSDHVEHFIPPKKGRAHIWRVIRDILSHKSKATRTDLALPLDYLNRTIKKKSVAFMVSDFQCEGYERTFKYTSKRHDLIAISINDPKEYTLPDVGLIELEDSENKEIVMLNSSQKSIRSKWKEIMEQEREKRKNMFRSFKVDEIEITTNGHLVEPLIRFFRQREKRL